MVELVGIDPCERDLEVMNDGLLQSVLVPLK